MMVFNKLRNEVFCMSDMLFNKILKLLWGLCTIMLENIFVGFVFMPKDIVF
jgi:hypothetical protein